MWIGSQWSFSFLFSKIKASDQNAAQFVEPSSEFGHFKSRNQTQPPIVSTHTPISHTFAAQTPILCARNKKKKKRRSGFERSTKLVLQLASLLALNLNILPPPLDLVVAEFSGGDGNGGGSRLWRRFGRGGGGGGGDGWRGKTNITPLLIGVLVVSGVALLFFTHFEINVICGVLGFAVFCVAFIQLLLKTAISKGFVLGFGLFGILIALD